MCNSYRGFRCSLFLIFGVFLVSSCGQQLDLVDDADKAHAEEALLERLDRAQRGEGAEQEGQERGEEKSKSKPKSKAKDKAKKLIISAAPDAQDSVAEDCPEGQKKCSSDNGDNFVCCALSDSCGSTPYDGGNNGESVAWCVPNPQTPCPQNTTLCQAAGAGSGRACCPANYTCNTYAQGAWCSPNSQNECPAGWGWKSCGLESICCPANATPVCWTAVPFGSTYAWCDDAGNGCAPGQTACGDYYCCNANEVCNTSMPSGLDYCSATSCPAGETMCSGIVNDYVKTICCPEGSCISSATGAATCTNTWPYSVPVLTPNKPVEEEDDEEDEGDDQSFSQEEHCSETDIKCLVSLK
jgi:hypothetical protein